MAWLPKINRHVQLLRRDSATVIRVKPGVIIGFAADTNPIIRVGRHDTIPGGAIQYETYGDATNGIPLRTNPDENQTVTKYIPA
jgi:hypothetical protein